MSVDSAENGTSPANGVAPDGRSICRDYLNKICNRGTRCKFYHPPGDNPNSGREEEFSFCIDYQVFRSFC